MPSQQPNVLLVCTDHWPGSLLECAGHPAVMTPTLNQIAANGIRFSNAYSPCPICVPARRTLMTGTTSQTHGLRGNGPDPMPEVPTLAQTFRDAGYQAAAVGKLHVFPQRQRLGFDDVILDEEGRGSLGCGQDDYELFLGDHGHPGQRFAGGMCNNDYMWRPWHLDEHLHVTNWAAQMMARTIKRRDPQRPGFWYLSFSHPHPPLAPLQAYLDIYRDVNPPSPYVGAWANENCAINYVRCRTGSGITNDYKTEQKIAGIRRAFYALCTHIDHQLRVVLGTLRDEGLLDNTVLMFTADHGDMLGNHHHWAKGVMYEDSNCVPMILSAPSVERIGHHIIDDRLVGLQDVMPTLLELADIPIPEDVTGVSMIGEQRHPYIFGEFGETTGATRMIREGNHKLIYYAQGNHIQLFDHEADPTELNDVADDPAYAEVKQHLTARLVEAMYGSDRDWIEDGELVGLPEGPFQRSTSHGYAGQRGSHWPPPS